MGVANDMAPHYFQMLERLVKVTLLGFAPNFSRNVILFENNFRYREVHEGSHIGLPGRFQGLNVGVVLYDLEKMRKSLR